MAVDAERVGSFGHCGGVDFFGEDGQGGACEDLPVFGVDPCLHDVLIAAGPRAAAAFLSDVVTAKLQREITEGLNAAGTFNGANSVLCYDKGGWIASNRDESDLCRS